MWQRYALSILLTLTATLAFAERPFPENAQRGVFAMANYPAVLIDGKQRRLSAGARIWNPQNTIDMPTAIPRGELVVNYTADLEGAIDRVWILTAQEASQRLPQSPQKSFR